MAITHPASTPLSNDLAITNYVVTADHSTATDVGWVDMRDYSSIGIRTIATALTGVGVDSFLIRVNTNSAGTGNETTIKTHAIGSAPDAVNDSLWLEVTAEEIAAESGEDGYAYRYVSAKIKAANAADDTAVVYIRKPKRSVRALTADVVA